MSYAETIAYLFSQLPMYQRVGKAAYKADLSNTIRMCELLGNPERAFPSAHIAGTNGKGSTSCMLASVLQEAGYKVGLFTSPHLKDFRERIRINGEMIPEQAIVDLVADKQELLAELSPSFFEWTAALAFQHFATEEVDIAVVEVGLGGRLDSTNVVNSIVSCVTSIGMDHANLLGDTLELIAEEKAGITKGSVALIVPEMMRADLKVIFRNKADQVHAPFTEAKAFLHPALQGEHQFSNAGCVIEMVHQLRRRSFDITDEQIVLGIQNILRNTGFRGRWELLRSSPRTIADVAHNREGIQAMLKLLAHEQYSKLHIVYGTVNDKDLSVILPLFPKDASYYFAKPDVPRGLDAASLSEKASEFGLIGKPFSSVQDAMSAALATTVDDELILITGSVFVVAEII